MTVDELLGKASELLQDVGRVRWSQDELLGWLNLGRLAAVTLKPNMHTEVRLLALVKGTRQALPADANVLMSVVRNMGTDGTKPGFAPRFIEREVMDSQNPNWHSDPANATVLHYTFDNRDPKGFYVYPPQPTTPGKVELLLGTLPPAMTADGDFCFDDVYAPALIDYVVSRAYMRDVEDGNGPPLAVAYMQSFTTQLGGQSQGEKAVNAAENTRGRA